MADLEPIVTELLRKTEAGRREHDTRQRRYNRSYDVYAASEPRARGTEPWQSKLRIPYARMTLDTGLVNLVGGIPRVLVQPRRPEDTLGAKAMQMVLDHYTTEDHLAEREAPFVQSGLIYGLAPAKVHWLYREGQVVGRDASGKAGPQTVVKADHPTFEPWDVYMTYWEPGAKDVDSASYVVLQSYQSKEELLAQQFNPETGTGLYHNLDELFKTGAAPQPKNTSQTRAHFINVPDRYKNKFLIEEIWTDEGVTVLGNRQILIRGPQPNPYWHGKKPVVIAQVRPDLFEMQGTPETEMVDHLQQALWTVKNMRFDNLHLTVMRGITYREGGVTDPNALQLRPRFKWPVQDHDDIRPFEVQPLPPEAYTEETSLINGMQMISGINPFVSGSDMANIDQNTATGVTALQETASRLLRFFARQVQQKGFQRCFEMWGDMTQQFLDKNLYIQITDSPETWAEVTPQDVIGHFRYKIEGSEESLSRQQERSEALGLLNSFAPLIQAGIVKPQPIVEKVAYSYGFQNPEELLAPPPQQAPPAAPAPPQNGAQPTNVQSVGQLLGGQRLNPSVFNAITRGR